MERARCTLAFDTSPQRIRVRLWAHLRQPLESVQPSLKTEVITMMEKVHFELVIN